MEKKQLITSTILMAFAGITLEEASRLPFGTLITPQAGFWPLILGVILAILSLVHFGKTVKRSSGKGSSFWAEPDSWKKIGLVVFSLVGFGFLFEPLGYLISVFLLIGFLLRIIKPLKWWLVFVVALLSSVLSYLIFGTLLSTPLPSGIFGF
jgi:putative tricarboxylic transport membrane protein